MTEQQTPDREKKIAEIREGYKSERDDNFTYKKEIVEQDIRFLLSELERLEREYAEERAAHNAHVTELCELEKENRKLREERDTIYADWNKEKDKQIQLTYELLTAQQEIDRLREERDDLIDGLLVYAEQRIGSDDDGEHARNILREIGVTVESEHLHDARVKIAKARFEERFSELAAEECLRIEARLRRGNE